MISFIDKSKWIQDCYRHLLNFDVFYEGECGRVSRFTYHIYICKKKKKKFKYSLRSMMIKILPESGTNWISGGEST